MKGDPLARLNERIVDCTACPRLITHCRKVAREKTARYRDQTYWGRPVPNFLSDDGHVEAAAIRLLIVGLAPAAHGANRTGRMFTGDRSGDFLFRGLHDAGLASQPTGTRRGDGLVLRHTLITAVAHCAPPGNKPTADELNRCRVHLADTFDALPGLRVVVTLGGLAHDRTLREYRQRGWLRRKKDAPFGHGEHYPFAQASPRAWPPDLLCCFHPSQQNTFTGRLTPAMLLDVFKQARRLIDSPRDPLKERT